MLKLYEKSIIVLLTNVLVNISNTFQELLE